MIGYDFEKDKEYFEGKKEDLNVKLNLYNISFEKQNRNSMNNNFSESMNTVKSLTFLYDDIIPTLPDNSYTILENDLTKVNTEVNLNNNFDHNDGDEGIDQEIIDTLLKDNIEEMEFEERVESVYRPDITNEDMNTKFMKEVEDFKIKSVIRYMSDEILRVNKKINDYAKTISILFRIKTMRAIYQTDSDNRLVALIPLFNNFDVVKKTEIEYIKECMKKTIERDLQLSDGQDVWYRKDNIRKEARNNLLEIICLDRFGILPVYGNFDYLMCYEQNIQENSFGSYYNLFPCQNHSFNLDDDQNVLKEVFDDKQQDVGLCMLNMDNGIDILDGREEVRIEFLSLENKNAVLRHKDYFFKHMLKLLLQLIPSYMEVSITPSTLNNSNSQQILFPYPQFAPNFEGILEPNFEGILEQNLLEADVKIQVKLPVEVYLYDKSVSLNITLENEDTFHFDAEIEGTIFPPNNFNCKNFFKDINNNKSIFLNIQQYVYKNNIDLKRILAGDTIIYRNAIAGQCYHRLAKYKTKEDFLKKCLRGLQLLCKQHNVTEQMVSNNKILQQIVSTLDSIGPLDKKDKFDEYMNMQIDEYTKNNNEYWKKIPFPDTYDDMKEYTRSRRTVHREWLKFLRRIDIQNDFDRIKENDKNGTSFQKRDRFLKLKNINLNMVYIQNEKLKEIVLNYLNVGAVHTSLDASPLDDAGDNNVEENDLNNHTIVFQDFLHFLYFNYDQHNDNLVNIDILNRDNEIQNYIIKKEEYENEEKKLFGCFFKIFNNNNQYRMLSIPFHIINKNKEEEEDYWKTKMKIGESDAKLLTELEYQITEKNYNQIFLEDNSEMEIEQNDDLSFNNVFLDHVGFIKIENTWVKESSSTIENPTTKNIYYSYR